MPDATVQIRDASSSKANARSPSACSSTGRGGLHEDQPLRRAMSSAHGPGSGRCGRPSNSSGSMIGCGATRRCCSSQRRHASRTCAYCCVRSWPRCRRSPWIAHVPSCSTDELFGDPGKRARGKRGVRLLLSWTNDELTYRWNVKKTAVFWPLLQLLEDRIGQVAQRLGRSPRPRHRVNTLAGIGCASQSRAGRTRARIDHAPAAEVVRLGGSATSRSRSASRRARSSTVPLAATTRSSSEIALGDPGDVVVRDERVRRRDQVVGAAFDTGSPSSASTDGLRLGDDDQLLVSSVHRDQVDVEGSRRRRMRALVVELLFVSLRRDRANDRDPATLRIAVAPRELEPVPLFLVTLMIQSVVTQSKRRRRAPPFSCGACSWSTLGEGEPQVGERLVGVPHGELAEGEPREA